LKKKYLITGAAGFIGFNLFNFLKKKKEEVIGLDNFIVKNSIHNKKKKIININILNKSKLKKKLANADIIIHLAAIENQNFIKKFPRKSYEINFNGTKNIVDQLNSNQTLIFFSSNLVYSKELKYFLSEKSKIEPQGIYGKSKLNAEKYIINKANKKKFKYFIIRNFSTFGNYQGKNSYIPTLIHSAIKEKKIEVWNTYKLRDIQYIDDLCQNIYNLILNNDGNKKSHIINSASGKSYTSKKIAKFIAKKLFAKCILKKENTKSYKKKTVVKIDKFKSLIKVKYKTTPINQSLSRTINFYKING